MFDFPNTPSVGDLFQDSSSGAVYRWNGYAWVGGITGIGLQTIKETRYLVAGSYTFTRDPKSSGFGDIHLLGAMGGRPAVTWASGQIVFTGSGGGGCIGIKWKYPLPASAPVIVGAGSGTAQAGTSSFDTVLTAAGGALAGGTTVAAAGTSIVAGSAQVAAGSSCDENYLGQPGAIALVTGGNSTGPPPAVCFLRGIQRRGAPPGTSGTASIIAQVGDAGAVVVVETLNP